MRAANPPSLSPQVTAMDVHGAALPSATRHAPGGDPPAAQALAQIEAVQATLQGCVLELKLANQRIRKKLGRSAVLLHAQEVLAHSEALERRVICGADALQTLQATLRLSLEDLQRIQGALALAQTEERQSRQRALHDQRTGLPNRELFDDRLNHAIAQARRHGWDLAVLFLDIDHFKRINDQHGHAAGDAVLSEFARRLTATARCDDSACRNGGDEFLFLLMNPQGRENIGRIVNALRASLIAPIDIGGLSVVAKASIGMAVYPDHGRTGEQLIANADAAMYRAKKAGRGPLFF